MKKTTTLNKDFRNKLFEGFEESWKRMNTECIYELTLIGDFSSIEDDYNYFSSTINIEYSKELYNLLPKNILTMGYLCTGCGQTMGINPKSLCHACSDNYGNDYWILDKNPNNEEAKGWVEYYSKRDQKEDYIVFSTESKIDLDEMRKNFKPGKYIKKIIVNKESNCGDLDNQDNVIAYNDMDIFQVSNY